MEVVCMIFAWVEIKWHMLCGRIAAFRLYRHLHISVGSPLPENLSRKCQWHRADVLYRMDRVEKLTAKYLRFRPLTAPED